MNWPKPLQNGSIKNGESLRFMAILAALPGRQDVDEFRIKIPAAYEPCGGEYKDWE